MNYTDQQLKAALAKMLPDRCIVDESYSSKDCEPRLRWLYRSEIHFNRNDLSVLDTELLHLCHLAECRLNNNEKEKYSSIAFEACEDVHGDADFFDMLNWSWQQRVVALAKVKGVEI